MIKNIEDVRKLVNEKKENMDEEMISALNVVLSEDDAFLRMPMKTSVGLLQFLGVDSNEVIEVYERLISLENNMPDHYITISNRK